MGSDVVSRFMDKVSPEPNSGCWLWAGGIGSWRYGCFNLKGVTRRAHIASFHLFKSKIPRGMCVLHKCDVPECVNPDHLFIGSIKENNLDRHKKGRTAKGERAGPSKLTADQVVQIRKDRRTHAEIAKSYSVSRPAVTDIKSYKNWRHIS